jgi:putative flippase GtrA
MTTTAHDSERCHGLAHLDVVRAVPEHLRRLAAVAQQLARYFAVSATALALDFAVFLTLVKLGFRPLLAGMIGYSVAMALHFFLSTRFVFDARATEKMQPRLFGEFVLSGLAGIGITAIVIALATDLFALPPLAAKGLAAAASFIVVFVLRRMVVFAEAPGHGLAGSPAQS